MGRKMREGEAVECSPTSKMVLLYTGVLQPVVTLTHTGNRPVYVYRFGIV